MIDPRLHDQEAALRAEVGAEAVHERLRFVPADQLRASAPPEPPWVWEGYLARGAVTLLAGKPKVGKSTLTFAIADAVASNAAEFLGRKIDGAPVVYVSEEGTGTLAHKMPSNGRISVLTRDAAWPKPEWLRLVQEVRDEVERIGAGLLVIDTLSFWGSLPAEREKDAGAVQALMEPLIALAATGLATLLDHHTRKGGGSDGEAVRGSSAFAGAVDVVLELERGTNAPPRQRTLLSLSRYPTTPGALVVDHDLVSGGWRLLGEGVERAHVRALQDQTALLDVLRSAGDDGRTRAELEEVLDAPARQWSPVLSGLTEDGQVERSGAGKKGDPYRYKMVRRNAAQGGGQHCAASEHAARSVFLRTPVGGAAETTNEAARETGADGGVRRNAAAPDEFEAATVAEEAEAERLRAKLDDPELELADVDHEWGDA